MREGAGPRKPLSINIPAGVAMDNDNQESFAKRVSPLDMGSEEFRALGSQLVDRIASFLDSLPERRVTPGESPFEVRQALGAERSLPQKGTDPGRLLNRAADLLFEHSLFNGHPRFWGYITSSAAPIGALGELLAAAVNPNVGAWLLSPMASEIEAQTIRWIAEILDYSRDCAGLFVSGGNMANLVCFLAARQAKADWDVRKTGMNGARLRLYGSKETHTWIQKAADISGLGTDAIRWIPTDDQFRIDLTVLREQIRSDMDAGETPFLVVGTAGSVSTGAIDPLPELAAICREFNVWFHVDGAYGALAAGLPDASRALAGLREADSVAVDPHKWLYAPLEAGCALVRNPEQLREAFAYHPPYYHFGAEAINYFDLGPQNSRGFRALKVWLALQQVGREGYVQMLSEDIRLARELFQRIPRYPALQAFTQSLSITTFRYVPQDLNSGDERVEHYLNHLNGELLTRLQNSGQAYLSNAVIHGKFALRVCIVNFRTSLADIEALLPLIVGMGEELDSALRPESFRRRVR
jgi:aromatic-L-amino-acid decarboxylase